MWVLGKLILFQARTKFCAVTAQARASTCEITVTVVEPLVTKSVSADAPTNMLLSVNGIREKMPYSVDG